MTKFENDSKPSAEDTERVSAIIDASLNPDDFNNSYFQPQENPNEEHQVGNQVPQAASLPDGVADQEELRYDYNTPEINEHEVQPNNTIFGIHHQPSLLEAVETSNTAMNPQLPISAVYLPYSSSYYPYPVGNTYYNNPHLLTQTSYFVSGVHQEINERDLQAMLPEASSNEFAVNQFINDEGSNSQVKGGIHLHENHHHYYNLGNVNVFQNSNFEIPEEPINNVAQLSSMNPDTESFKYSNDPNLMQFITPLQQEIGLKRDNTKEEKQATSLPIPKDQLDRLMPTQAEYDANALNARISRQNDKNGTDLKLEGNDLSNYQAYKKKWREIDKLILDKSTKEKLKNYFKRERQRNKHKYSGLSMFSKPQKTKKKRPRNSISQKKITQGQEVSKTNGHKL